MKEAARDGEGGRQVLEISFRGCLAFYEYYRLWRRHLTALDDEIIEGMEAREQHSFKFVLVAVHRCSWI